MAREHAFKICSAIGALTFFLMRTVTLKSYVAPLTVLNFLFHWSPLICTSIVLRDRGIVM